MKPRMLRDHRSEAGGGGAPGQPGAQQPNPNPNSNNPTNPPAGGQPGSPGTPADAGKGAQAPHVSHDEVVGQGKRIQKLEDRGRRSQTVLDAIAKKLGIDIPTDDDGDGTPSSQPNDPRQQQRRTPDGSDDAVTRGELALRDAIIDAQVSLSPDQRDGITKLFRAEKPTDVDGWLKKWLPAFGVKPGTQAVPPARKEAVTNTGAPGNNPVVTRPKIGESSIEEVREFYRTASPEEKQAVWDEFEKSSGGRSDHFARRRRK